METNDEQFFKLLRKVCERFGYKMGREVIVDFPSHTFVINDPEISKRKRLKLAVALGDAIEAYRRGATPGQLFSQ